MFGTGIDDSEKKRMFGWGLKVLGVGEGGLKVLGSFALRSLSWRERERE